jgi:NifB/MoaA-like Fe-S oxidoreductase
VFASDEYYLLAGRPFPATEHYDGFPQHENGIGMARAFGDEVRAALGGDDGVGRRPRSGFFAWVDGAPAEGYRAFRVDGQAAIPTARGAANGRTIAIITGEMGAPVLAPFLDDLADHAKAPVRLVPVANQFFGGNIGVTGLLTGADLVARLAGEPDGDRYLLPDVALSQGRFLDGMTLAELPRVVEAVPTDGQSLVRALRKAPIRISIAAGS